MDRKLLDRYLKGDCTEAERLQVEAWLQKEDALPATPPRNTLHGKQIWLQLKTRINGNRRFPRKTLTIAAAAMLLVLLAVTQLVRKPAEPEWITVDNPSGKQLTLTLPDNSIIHLAGGTTLSYPRKFTGTQREVRFIKGEAYFSVHANPQMPFVVSNPDSSKILVLGTEFNVRLPLQITLISGKVAWKKGTEQQTLLPGEQLSLINGNASKQHVTNAQLTGAWKDGVLWFDRTPVAEVLDRIERYYGIRFSGEENVEQQEISGKFIRQPLDEVLRIIGQTMGISFQREERNVKIINKQ